jgi:uncharacterized protein (TIGR03663 family)
VPRGRRRLRTRLLAVAAVALCVRLLALGARTAHWDEARVGLRTLQYLQSGVWSYDPLVHGPLLFHLNRVLFDLLGPSDATARLVPAVGGGLLPLSAWLFRERLDDAETLAVAVVLATNPILLYYSRFARNDLPLAAAMLVAFGLLVRARDRGRDRYVVAAAVVAALGIGLKENAVLYLACWLGSLAALWVLRARRVGGPCATLRDVASRVRTRTRWSALLAAPAAWVGVVVLLYAPRDPTGLGLWSAVAAPERLPALLQAATLDPAARLVDVWVTGESHLFDPRTPFYAAHLLAVLGVGATATLALGAAGLVDERRGGESRPLVQFAAAWAGFSLLGYPLAADLAAPWLAVHVAAPLSIPAGVGLARLFARHREAAAALPARPPVTAALLVLLVLSVHVVVVGAVTSYAAPDHRLNPLGQPAQPGPDADAAGRAVDRALCRGETVLFYGDYFDPRYDWRRLPLSWDVAVAGGTEGHTPTGSLPSDPPPVVVALSGRHPGIDEQLSDYERLSVELDPWVDREPDAPFTTASVYVENARLARGCETVDETGQSPPASAA